MAQKKWVEPKIEERKFTTQLFYGKIVINHFDKDTIEMIEHEIKKILPEKYHRSISTYWIFHKDGKEYIDARLTSSGWEKEK